MPFFIRPQRDRVVAVYMDRKLMGTIDFVPREDTGRGLVLRCDFDPGVKFDLHYQRNHTFGDYEPPDEFPNYVPYDADNLE